jgi:hypothetical protein
MTPKINRRRYDVLTKFLKEMIVNSKSDKVRMQAAERLDGIYARHEQYEQQALQRKHRADIRALATQEQQGATDASQPLSQNHEQEPKSQVDIENFLKLIKKRPEPSTDAAAD